MLLVALLTAALVSSDPGKEAEVESVLRFRPPETRMVENTGPVWVWPVWSVDDEIASAEVFREDTLLPASYRPRLKELWLPLRSQ
ncbi:MAG: hypothetical protein ACOCX1_02440, partial [Fimbriimonadaceae bacterium]